MFLVSAQLESLYICISLDYLMTLQDFFISGLPTGGGEARSRAVSVAAADRPSSESEKNRLNVDQPSVRPSNAVPRTPNPSSQRENSFNAKRVSANIRSFSASTPAPPAVDNEVETRIDVIVKHPEVILLEDQHNSNSNCLVLDVSLVTGLHRHVVRL